MGWLQRFFRESPPVTSPEVLKQEMAQLMAEVKKAYEQIAELHHENELLKQEVTQLKAKQ